jgi:predicted deacetylase
LSRDDTIRRVRTGRRLLSEIELDPIGFVAPGYAYTRALKEELSESFEWFADLRRISVVGGADVKSPALCLGASTLLKRALSPAVVRAAARAISGPVMRIDIHPADFDLPGHVETLEGLLDRAAGRDAVTYDELIACNE